MYNVRKVARFSRIKPVSNSRELQQITDPKLHDGNAIFLYKKDDRKLAGRIMEGEFRDLRRVGIEAAIVLRDDVIYTFNATTQLETTDDARTLDRGSIELAFYLGKHKVYTIDATEFRLAAEIVCHEVGLRIPYEDGRHACPCIPKKECPTTLTAESAPKKAESKPKKAKSERQKSKASAKKARATRRAIKASAPKKANSSRRLVFEDGYEITITGKLRANTSKRCGRSRYVYKRCSSAEEMFSLGIRNACIYGMMG